CRARVAVGRRLATFPPRRSSDLVVFLDPPFADDCWPQLLAALPSCLKPGALVYCERAVALKDMPGWTVFRSGRAGQVSHQLLKKIGSAHRLNSSHVKISYAVFCL